MISCLFFCEPLFNNLFLKFNIYYLNYIENTGTHTRIKTESANGGEEHHIREFWTDPRYVVFLNVLRQIICEPLVGTVVDLEIAL